MAGGNGKADRSDTATVPRRKFSTPSDRPPRAEDLPPLRNWHTGRTWLPWALFALACLVILAMAVNALDFSRRQQLVERQLDVAIDQRDLLRDEIDTAPPSSVVSVPSTDDTGPATAEQILADARAGELERRAAELDERAAELDARDVELTEREAALDRPETGDPSVGTDTTARDGTAAPAEFFASGVFEVGVDVAMGTYRTDAPAGCRYRKLGPSDEVLFTDSRSERGLVSITLGAGVDRFDSSGCGIWGRVG